MVERSAPLGTGRARPDQHKNEAVPASDVNLCGKLVDFWWITCGKLNFLVENSENVEKVGGKCGKLAQKVRKMWITCGKVVDNSPNLLVYVEKWWVFGGLDVERLIKKSVLPPFLKFIFKTHFMPTFFAGKSNF